MSEELESCPVCGALPIDQVDSGAVRELVRDRYKFSRQELLDDCASREALEKCAQQFDFYAREHAVKADRALCAGKHEEARASASKAKVNADFAAMCNAALKEPKP